MLFEYGDDHIPQSMLTTTSHTTTGCSTAGRNHPTAQTTRPMSPPKPQPPHRLTLESSAVTSRQVTIPSHLISSHPISSRRVPHSAKTGAHMHLSVPALFQAWHSCGTALAHTIHPISSHPVLSNPIPSGHHPIPYHTIPCHLVCKGAAAYHGRGTHVSGCANPFQGVALLRHSSGAHNTSHSISSHHVQSHPVRSPSHPIPPLPLTDLVLDDFHVWSFAFSGSCGCVGR